MDKLLLYNVGYFMF